MAPGRDAVSGVIPAALTPATLGDYSILLRLAQGGMATIYVARKTGVAGFERLVAIKCCHPHLCEDEEFVSMFLDEARLAARIHHPNVVPTLDVHCSDHLYLVMDYVEGGSLAALLRHARKVGSPLPIEVAVAVMMDTLTGLHAAHELADSDGDPVNLVHRDVSPQNILVGADGVSRITDFGIAFAAARSTVTQAGRLKGKLSYMAPEQARGLPVTRRTDVFAAGSVLWEALTGRPLFRRREDAATINAVLVQEVPAPSSVTPAVPAALDAVVLKALERDPANRYASAADFADALESLPVRRATAREVAQYVQGALGPVLAERREFMRRTSDVRAILPDRSSASLALSLPRGLDGDLAGALDGTREDEITLKVDHLTLQRMASVILPPGYAPSDDIEHRRIRSLLAAAMLLLVGSAIGLLLARSGRDPTPQPAPAVTTTASDPSH